MKRGLKVNETGADYAIVSSVTIVSPMKRGLKANYPITGIERSDLLQSFPR